MAMPAVAQMELNGMQLDEDRLAAITLDLEAQKQAALNQLKTLKLHRPQLSLLPEITDCVNPESPQQVLQALQALGIPIDSTSKKSLIPLADQYPIIRNLLDYRKLSKITSTFASALPKHVHPVTEGFTRTIDSAGHAAGDSAAATLTFKIYHEIKR
jgi:DNA polymerase-1